MPETLFSVEPSERTQEAVVNVVRGKLEAMVSMIPEDQDEALEVIQKMHRHFSRKLASHVRNSIYGARDFKLSDTYFKTGKGRAILMEAIPLAEHITMIEEQVDTLNGGHYDTDNRWVPNPQLNVLIEQVDAAREDMTKVARKIMKDGFKR